MHIEKEQLRGSVEEVGKILVEVIRTFTRAEKTAMRAALLKKPEVA